ncbi:MAG: hypothetical protein IT366_22690 [Candidatus Hydrogenedentes bacterium]|nr:hypothetical protein [Candidatus Hydrogenedentota bacterium]
MGERTCAVNTAAPAVSHAPVSRRYVEMLKQQFEKLLAAERDARERIADAELRARQIVDAARGKRGERITQVHDDALREADAILEQARAESSEERVRIMMDAHAKAEAMLAAADKVEDAFVQRAARSVAGLDL